MEMSDINTISRLDGELKGIEKKLNRFKEIYNKSPETLNMYNELKFDYDLTVRVTREIVWAVVCDLEREREEISSKIKLMLKKKFQVKSS